MLIVEMPMIVPVETVVPYNISVHQHYISEVVKAFASLQISRE